VKTFLRFLCVLVLVPSLRASFNTVPIQVNLDGSRVYSYSYGVTNVRRIIVFKKIAGVETTVHDSSYSPPGGGAGATISGTLTVAAGVSVQIYWQWWGDGAPSFGNWQQSPVPDQTLTPVYRVGFHYVNDKPYPVKVALIKDGVIIGYQTVGANSTMTGEIAGVPMETTYELAVQLGGVDFSDGQWVVAEGSTYTSSYTTPVPSSNLINVGSSAVPTPLVVDVGTVTDLPSDLPSGSTGGGTVWNAPTATGSTDGLSNPVFREGVDKITARQDKQQKSLDKLTAHTTALETLRDARPSDASQASAGSAAKTDADSKFASLPSASSKTATTSAPTWTVTNSLVGTVDINPFRSDRFGPIASWFRSAFSWLLGVLFAIAVAKEASACIKGVSQAQQAKGNPVLAGTGAQATALIAAGVMTALIVAAIVAVIALAVSDFGFGTLASVFSANPYSGLPGGVAYCLDQVMNLGHVVLYLLSLATLPLFFAKIFAATSAAVRFVVP